MKTILKQTAYLLLITVLIGNNGCKRHDNDESDDYESMMFIKYTLNGVQHDDYDFCSYYSENNKFGINSGMYHNNGNTKILLSITISEPLIPHTTYQISNDVSTNMQNYVICVIETNDTTKTYVSGINSGEITINEIVDLDNGYTGLKGTFHFTATTPPNPSDGINVTNGEFFALHWEP
jgi:hypothetical protein